MWLHYRVNVWPIARAIVASRLHNKFDSPLLLEGSAILPELVNEISGVEVSSLWLVAPKNLLSVRIRRVSSYETRLESERSLIDTFIRRAVGFDEQLRVSLADTGLQSNQVSQGVSADQLAETVRNKVF